MILVKWPMWRTILFRVFVYTFKFLHVCSTSCSSSGETNCVNTTSGSCRWPCCAGRKWNFQPAHYTTTDTEWQLPEVVLTQFVFPDDEHDVLETCRELKKYINKYIEKNCASHWSFNKHHYMQAGISFCRHTNPELSHMSFIRLESGSVDNTHSEWSSDRFLWDYFKGWLLWTN